MGKVKKTGRYGIRGQPGSLHGVHKRGYGWCICYRDHCPRCLGYGSAGIIAE